MQQWMAIPGVRVQELTGAPVALEDYTLTPVARLFSWRGGADSATSGGGGAFLHLRPTAVRVATQDGIEQTIPIVHPDQRTLLLLAGIALAIAVGCGVVMAAISRVSQWEREKDYAK